ncbi:unnamed protein product, partial [marine sediment metagenome]
MRAPDFAITDATELKSREISYPTFLLSYFENLITMLGGIAASCSTP